MTTFSPVWSRVAVLVARLIFASMFAMAMVFKFMAPTDTAGYIATIGFPAPLLFAWLAAFFELALVAAFLTGAFFREAALAAVAYVLFLAFAFHGPSHWAASQAEFGFFVDHFTFIAGLLFAAVHGPGDVLWSRSACSGSQSRPKPPSSWQGRRLDDLRTSHGLARPLHLRCLAPAGDGRPHRYRRLLLFRLPGDVATEAEPPGSQ